MASHVVRDFEVGLVVAGFFLGHRLTGPCPTLLHSHSNDHPQIAYCLLYYIFTKGVGVIKSVARMFELRPESNL